VKFWDFVTTVFDWLKQQGPALAMLVYNWKDAKEKRAVQKQKRAEYELEIQKNHAKVDADNANVSDVDGVNKIAGPKR
jgi:hypothetical protein